MADQRYLVLFGACLTQFTVIGMLFTVGLIFNPFETELGWSRTMLSACSALAFFVMGTVAILGGRLSDSLGPRIVLGATGVAYGAGFVLLSRVTAPWQVFLIFGTLIGMGLGTHDVVTLSTMARWFHRRRGLMSGVIKVGTALGQVAVPPVAALLITGYGWRQALVVMGVITAVLLVIAALSMRRPPDPSPDAARVQLHGISFAEARHLRLFWTLCAIQFLFFPTLMTVPLHLAVHGTDLGLSPTAAAALLSVIGAASIAGRLTIGALVDRIGGRNGYSLCLAVLLVSLLGLMATTGPATLYAIVAVYGFGHGALFVVVSPSVAEYFGMRAHGAIFGAVLFFGTVGGSVGPILAGWVFDSTGSYQPAFITLACGAGLALVLARTLPRT